MLIFYFCKVSSIIWHVATFIPISVEQNAQNVQSKQSG